MESNGIVEVIALLLSLGGFGLHANAKAPAADASLEYAVSDADIVMHVDAQAIIPGNYKALVALPSQPSIASSPELAVKLREGIAQVEGARAQAKLATGIDFTTDVLDGTAFFQLVPHKDPNFLAAVHGNFTTDNVDKIAAATHHTATKAGGGAWSDVDDKTSIAVTKDHVLLVGTSAFVKARLAESWHAPSHAAGTTLAYAAQLIDSKPVVGWAMTLSAAARKDATSNFDQPNFATDIINRHKGTTFAIYSDGVGWTWTDSTKAGLESFATMSDGLIDLMRAAEIAPRGFAKIALGALDSYKNDKRVAELLKHRDDLMKVVNEYTGDGNFKVATNKDAAHLSLSVRATGKSASEVVSLGMLPVLGAFAYFGMREASMAPRAPAMAVPAPAPRHP